MQKRQEVEEEQELKMVRVEGNRNQPFHHKTRRI